MRATAVVDELMLPLNGPRADLQALAVGMILESELGIALTDTELTVDVLGTRELVLALLARHGIS